MKRIRNHLLFSVVLVVCLAAMGNAVAQSSASYELSRCVMSGGGTTSTWASYELTGTFGQPSPRVPPQMLYSRRSLFRSSTS